MFAVLAAAAILPSRAPPPRAAVGFGPQTPPPSQPAQQLDADAQALLEEAGGDVNKARMSYIGYTLAYLEEEMPELYTALKTDPSRPDAHAALVEVTWDAIAAFLPMTHSPTPTPAAQRKLTAIARAGCDGACASPAVLDVGCGNGLLLPFLTACGAPPSSYRGIDLSGRMIECAQAAHTDAAYSGARFEDVNFADVVDEAKQAEESGAEPRKYDSVIFNGSLQFFGAPSSALAAASTLLAAGEHSRLVVSHLNGARFVRKEREDNPTTVLSTMPSLAELEAAASPLGLQVVVPSFLGDEPAAIEAAMEDFYLVVLRWDAEHGGTDGLGAGAD